MDSKDINEKYAHWMKALIWFAVIAVVLVVYVFVYPVVLLAFETRIGFIDDLPTWSGEPLKLSAAPLVRMAEEIPAYEAYIGWLDTIF